ncbi:MAG: hypothetical protein IJO32_05250 [Bacilli bacterium]|nr:hypothetical protein [Bacilli bacterium]
MTNLEESILKEFDRQRFNNINISFIMDKLDLIFFNMILKMKKSIL